MRKGAVRVERQGPRMRQAASLLLLFATVACGTVQMHPERWRWSNPLPHGNNVLDMRVTSDLSLQVGDGGSLHIRRSDSRWAPAYTGVTNYLRGTAMLGSRLLAVGESGCIVWSDDGRTFQTAQLTPGTADWFEGVAASGQRAVAVGDYGAIYASTNGADWARATSGTVQWLRGAAFGNGAFVAVGENGTILRSTNGTGWTSVAGGTGEDLNRVRFVGKGTAARFVAVGNRGTALSSPTGNAPWTVLPTGTTNTLYDAAANDRGLLLVGDQEIRFQADGTSDWIDQIDGPVSNAAPAWTYLSAAGESNSWWVAGRTGLLLEGSGGISNDFSWSNFPDYSPRAWIWDVAIQKGICVAVGDLACIQTSLDGILWAREAVPVSVTNTVFLGVGGTSNLLLAVGSDGAMVASRAGLVSITVTNEIDGMPVVTNMDVEGFGVIWSNVPAFTANSLQGVAATDGLFLVCGDNGSVYAGTNGIDWQARPTPATQFLTGVAIGPTACVAVGAGGTLLRADPDGTGWSAIDSGTTDWIHRVRWLGDAFVAVGQNGTILTSADGSGWIRRTSGTSRWLSDVTRIEDHWFITGYQGTLLMSTNLVTWSRQPLPTIKSLFAACSREGKLILAGIEGIILRNQVAPITTPIRFLEYTPAVVENADSSRSLYEVFLLGGRPDQFFSFDSSTNLTNSEWRTLGELEMYDPSGTLYLLRSGDLSSIPSTETYRTTLNP